MVTWDRTILCLPKGYGALEQSRITAIPKGKARAALQARGLCGKIRLHSDMTEDEVLSEVRSAFRDAMEDDSSFHFRFLQTGGGGTKSLTVPAVSASFTWTPKEVAKLSGQGCLYIEAQAELKVNRNLKEDAIGDDEIDLTKGEAESDEVHTLSTCSTCIYVQTSDTISFN